MTEDESLRAYDVGPMYVVLPSIVTSHDIAAVYENVPAAPVGGYRSDGVAPMDGAEVEAVLRAAVDEVQL
jgi:hypothetical protein